MELDSHITAGKERNDGVLTIMPVFLHCFGQSRDLLRFLSWFCLFYQICRWVAVLLADCLFYASIYQHLDRSQGSVIEKKEVKQTLIKPVPKLITLTVLNGKENCKSKRK